MLCTNESGAPCTLHPACSSYCLAPKNLTPIIKLCTVAVQRQGQRVTLYWCSRQWRSSYPAHSLQLVIFTGPSKSVFLQYMTSTISQYKPRLWWYCHQFTTTLTTTLFIKQCAVNAECYHCTMKSSRLQPSESCNHRQFEYHQRVSSIAMELLHILDFNLHSTWDYGSCIGWQYCISTISACEWIDLTEPQLYNTEHCKPQAL